jgi:hypothetical protein
LGGARCAKLGCAKLGGAKIPLLDQYNGYLNKNNKEARPFELFELAGKNDFLILLGLLNHCGLVWKNTRSLECCAPAPLVYLEKSGFLIRRSKQFLLCEVRILHLDQRRR